MTDKQIVELIQSNINLLGYGLSSNWLGYSERIKQFDENIAKKVINVFLSIFIDKKVILITSAVKIKGRVIDDNLVLVKKIEAIENRLINLNLIKIIEGFDNKYLEDYPKAIKYPDFNVIRNCSKRTIVDFSTLFFIDSSIEGHCFFFIENDNLLVYPHEDTGFGFIKVNDRYNQSKLRIFFDTLSKDSDFEVINKHSQLNDEVKDLT